MCLSRILLAAPDPQALGTHRAFLAQLGYDVAVCGDGLACADRLRHDRPDLLVLALDLPWGRGEGVLALMADGDLPAVPVVLLADHPSPPRLAAVGRSPVRSFLPWPAPPHRLGHAVRWVLSDAGLGHPSADLEAEDEWTALRFRPIA
jgi:DNA-binding NtrC family response regulator